MDQSRRRCLALVPDLPRWVETRALLLWDGSSVVESLARDGFIVWSESDGIGSVVGVPDALALSHAAGQLSELLAFPENVEKVQALVPGFRKESATVFSAPSQLPASPAHACRRVSQSEIASQKHLPAGLQDELSEVAEEGVIVIAAFCGSLPVAFAYAASETETLWDVSIDTVEGHRRKGYSAAAVVHLIHLMKKHGKTAVWGALESNEASANLARRLGFVEVEEIWVYTRVTT